MEVEFNLPGRRLRRRPGLPTQLKQQTKDTGVRVRDGCEDKRDGSEDKDGCEDRQTGVRMDGDD